MANKQNKKNNSQRTANKQNKAKKTDTQALTKFDKKSVKKGNEKAVTKYVQEAPNKGGFNWKRPLLLTLTYFGLAILLTVSPIDVIPDMLAGVYGLGYYDDVSYFLIALIASIIEWKKSFEKIK